MADRHIIGMQVIFADRAHHHFAGVKAYPHLQRRMAFGTHRVRIAPHRFLHAERRVHRPLGMIFMRERGTKEGEDTVAQGLRDVAVVLMHGVHHELQRRIDNRAHLFRVEAFDQRRRAFEIGKQRGDRLALAVRRTPCFERGLLGADAFGEMGRRVVSDAALSRDGISGWFEYGIFLCLRGAAL